MKSWWIADGLANRRMQIAIDFDSIVDEETLLDRRDFKKHN
jgi:hypothetical protein